MGYAIAAVVILFALVVIGRLASRRMQPAVVPASELLPRPSMTPVIAPAMAAVPQPGAQGTTVKLRPAPGAPNTDPPTDQQVTERGTATITRRTGRRRSTTSA